MKKYNDYIVLFLALGTAFVFVYFIPAVLNRFLFFIFIYLFYKSDRDYLWIAFIFIIMESPGKLFAGGSVTEQIRIPIYNIAPGISVTFTQIFILTALVKAIGKKTKFNPVLFLKKNLMILFFYFILLIIIGILLGFEETAATRVYQITISLSLFYSVYFLLNKEKDYINFFRMLIPFGFIAFGLQLYSVNAGNPLVLTIDPQTERHITGVFNYELDEVRPIEMTQTVALLFFFSMYFLLHKKEYFNRNLLISLIIVCFFSITINATRSFFIMIFMFLLFCFIFLSAKIGNMLMRYSLAGIISVLIIFSADLFVNQLNRAFKRISTIENVLEGDITGGGTILRYDQRAPDLMEVFSKESTVIFGAGFSELYFEKSDHHIGFHNLLFNTGFIGVILFLMFFGSVILNTIKINKELHYNNPYKNVLKIFPIVIISIIFVNSGTQFFGYDVAVNRIILFVFILYFLNNQISCALQWENENDLRLSD